VTPGLAILITGTLVAAACSTLGTFLVLRRSSMMADAISHAILPGLVVGYAVAGGPNLLAAFVGAFGASVVLVALVERLVRTRLVANDAAIGLSFSAMFALGTILVTRLFSDVHLDTDAVLYGSIEFAGFDRLFVAGVDLGPRPVWLMGGLCLLNGLFVAVAYKELVLTTFDPALAAALGFAPAALHYPLMALVSITAVGAFTAVGAVLALALLIVPAATARLLTNRLGVMLVLAPIVGAGSAAVGYAVALAGDVSVSGMMASATGVAFLAALVWHRIRLRAGRATSAGADRRALSLRAANPAR
jgi:manganese/zinc/iron transport system permease protein